MSKNKEIVINLFREVVYCHINSLSNKTKSVTFIISELTDFAHLIPEIKKNMKEMAKLNKNKKSKESAKKDKKKEVQISDSDSSESEGEGENKKKKKKSKRGCESSDEEVKIITKSSKNKKSKKVVESTSEED